jgi:hypothetical protein
MKRVVLGAIATLLCLSGCNNPKDAEGSPGGAHGRYAGVGIYPAGRMWSQMVVANAPKDAGASKLNDDEQVIVVMDTHTGELRECGNLTGYCVGMTPWSKALGGPQAAPILVTKHADELAREDEAEAKKAASAAPAH